MVAPLKNPPGEKFVYSDVGYIVLGDLVRKVDGRTLDRFAEEEIFGPLMMGRTRFKPGFGDSALLVPTESIDGEYKPGIVHDPRARAMGGVAGHAGLFGSASDLARYCQMLLNGGELNGKRIMSVETVKLMLTPRPSPDEQVLRMYGFDVVSPYDSPRGKHFPKGVSFGHTGFTGCSMWIDPQSKTFVILMTSRLHPDGKGDVKKLRSDVATAVAEATGIGG
jgi:CubicO group peptidase (beta-lactamase class C family)